MVQEPRRDSSAPYGLPRNHSTLFAPPLNTVAALGSLLTGGRLTSTTGECICVYGCEGAACLGGQGIEWFMEGCSECKCKKG